MSSVGRSGLSNDDQSNEKGPATMKLTTVTHVSVDGVMQGLGGSDEDRGADSSAADGPCRSSTTRPRRSSARSSSAPTRSYSAGRPTRNLPAPGEPAPGGQTRATTRSRWREHAAQVRSIDHAHRPAMGGHERPLRRSRGRRRRAESQPEGELQVHGSGNLVRWLVDNHLVDEIALLTYPVVVGRARGCSPTPARTRRLNWSTRGPPPSA